MGFKVDTANRPLLGEQWNNGSQCGSRGSNWNNSPLNLNSNNSARGVTETKGLTLRLAVSTCLHCRQIHYGGSPWLVGRPEAWGSIYS